jgi:2-oxoglutarate/2-oxoacid ferredoxin oxidoreductase subunit beta
MSSAPSLPILTAEDLATNQEVRWCPGCGDFSILAQLKQVLAGLGLPRENLVFVSGIGCASRLPYYLNTYGFQGIQGRSPALATGLKVANPELQIWVVTGDGDGLSVGTNHLVHALRRNVDIKIILFNNEVFGMTRGQFSPTSRLGTRTKSSPEGSFDNPLRALSLALGAEATFVARSIDVDVNHLTEVLRRAAQHKGAAFVEVYQNCKVFNDGVFDYATDKSVKAEQTLYLEHGRPLLFGKDRNLGIRLNGLAPEVVTLGNSITMDDLLSHDERAEEPTLAFLLSRLVFPEFPECLGVFRAVEKPTYEALLHRQIAEARSARGPGKLEHLLAGDETWTVG